MSLKSKLTFCGVVALVLGAAPVLLAQTSGELWTAFSAAPGTHPNIPDVSYAGYARGERSLPELTATIDVKALGAVGDGQTDDTAAFEAALAQAKSGCGAISVPAGTYRLSRPLYFADSGVVLKGAGSGKTRLDFQVSLTDVIGSLPSGTSSQWSWSGGLIWIGPKDTFDDAHHVVEQGYLAVQGWEYWRPSGPAIPVTSEQLRGDRELTVADASSLKVGQLVLMSWENPADASLLKHVYGHAGTAESVDWNAASWLAPASYPRFQWPVAIAALDGNKVRLAQPLRLDVRPSFNVRIEQIGTHVREVGIEGITLVLHAPDRHTHLKNVGYNGLYFNRAYNCWARDVTIVNAENPVIVAASKNVSVLDVRVSGPSQNHHSLACRVNSHDNLFQGFTVDGPGRVKHGINVEWLSSGNVWSHGVQKMGTFDTHRALAFDNVRTQLTVRDEQDAAPGGAGEAGPFIGARMVHWNVDNQNTNPPKSDPGQFINHPEQYSMGAMVGVLGPRATSAPSAMPSGDKGTIVADEGKAPEPLNLYDAQLALRTGTTSAPATERPACGAAEEPSAIDGPGMPNGGVTGGNEGNGTGVDGGADDGPNGSSGDVASSHKGGCSIGPSSQSPSDSTSLMLLALGFGALARRRTSRSGGR